MLRNWRNAFVVLVAAALAACNGGSTKKDGPTTEDAGKAFVRVQFGSAYSPGSGFTMTLRAFDAVDQTWSSDGPFYDEGIEGSAGTWSHDFESVAPGGYTFCARGLADGIEIDPVCVNATVTKNQTVTADIVLRPPTVKVFDTLPDVLPPNRPSQPFQAQQTAEFGDEIALAPGTGRHPVAATVMMSTWSTTAYSHPITLNLYSVSEGALAPLATRTQTFDIPARPADDPVHCPGAGRWLASDGNCYSGLAFTITFDLSGLDVLLPDSLAYGIAYDTQTWGYSPLGVDGPYNSLNVALIGDGSTAASAQPSVGTDPDSDALLRNYWNFSAGPAAYTGFVPETDWTGWAPAVELLAY